MKNRQCSACIAPEDYEQLRRLALAVERSVGSLVRIAVRDCLKSSEAAPGKDGPAMKSVTALDHVTAGVGGSREPV